MFISCYRAVMKVLKLKSGGKYPPFRVFFPHQIEPGPESGESRRVLVGPVCTSKAIGSTQGGKRHRSQPRILRVGSQPHRREISCVSWVMASSWSKGLEFKTSEQLLYNVTYHFASNLAHISFSLTTYHDKRALENLPSDSHPPGQPHPYCGPRLHCLSTSTVFQIRRLEGSRRR